MRVKITLVDGRKEFRYAKEVAVNIYLCASVLTPTEIAKIKDGCWMVVDSTGFVVRPSDKIDRFTELTIKPGNQDVEEARRVRLFRARLAYHEAYQALIIRGNHQEYERIVREFPDQVEAIAVVSLRTPYCAALAFRLIHYPCHLHVRKTPDRRSIFAQCETPKALGHFFCSDNR